MESSLRTAVFRLWPTPMAGSHDRDTLKLDPRAQRCAGTKRQIDLHTAARNWPTPVPSQMTGDYTRDSGDRRKERLTLKGLAKQWRTPTASQADKGGPNNRDSSGALQPTAQAIRWATPTASDGKGGPGRGRQKKGGDNLRPQIVSFHHSRLASTTSTGGGNTSRTIIVLNPLFVEALMGLPIGWTELQRPAMESFRSWRLTHTRLLRAALNLD
jgi:hypothetical protein